MTLEKLPIQRRSFTLQRDAIDLVAGTVQIACSSEDCVVPRWWGNEVLDHSPGAIVMDRAAMDKGLPLLFNHDCDQLIGRVRDFKLVPKEKITRGVATFATDEESQERYQQVKDDVLVDVSIGYRVLEVTTQNPGKPNEVQLVTKWEPMEVSMVSVPADAGVGVGRGAPEEFPVRVVRSEVEVPPQPAPAAATKEIPMESQSPVAGQVPAPPAALQSINIQELRTSIQKDAQANASEILKLAMQHGMEARASEFLEKGLSLDQVRAEILNSFQNTAKPLPPAKGNGLDMNAKEVKNYSLLRAMRGIMERKNCPELEISQDIAKREGRSTSGFYLPLEGMLQTRAGLDTSTATKGAEAKFIEPGTFIDLLRNRMMVAKLGATILDGLQGNIAFPRQTGAGTAVWLATENPGSDAADSNLLLDQVTLAPKTLVSSTSYSRQLLLQAAFSIEEKVRMDLMQILSLAIDLAAINGSGASGQPLGILGTAGIGSVALGTNGLAIPSITPLVDLESQITSANADINTLAYLTTPGQRGVMKKTQQFASANGMPIWSENGLVNGYRAESSAQVPNNLTKGTSNGICHAVIFGNWQELLIGYWGGASVEILVDELRLKKQAMVEITAIQLAGIAVRHAASFAAIKDAL